MTASDAAGAAPTALVPGSTAHPLDPARHGEAAAILAACPGVGTAGAGGAVLAEAVADPDQAVYGLVIGGALAGVYVTRKIGLAVEVTHLAVAANARGRGYGRACLTDALRRAGKRPLVVEADETTVGFYRTCGFKLVGRRRHPNGVVQYRLGWHAPQARDVLRSRHQGRSTAPIPAAASGEGDSPGGSG